MIYDRDPEALRNEAHRLRHKAIELDRQAKLIELDYLLDQLQVPRDAGSRQIRDALRAHGTSVDNNLLSKFVTHRKTRVTRADRLSGDHQDNS